MREIIDVLVVALLVLGIGVWVGWHAANDWRNRRGEQLDQEEAELRAGWDALHRAQRVNAAFWQARQALRNEAMRHRRGADRQ